MAKEWFPQAPSKKADWGRAGRKKTAGFSANKTEKICERRTEFRERRKSERGKKKMAIVKSILENVIKSGKFDLDRATELIETGYAEGAYTAEERAALLALRDQHLTAENQRPEVLEAMARLEAAMTGRLTALEARVAELESGGAGEAGGDTPAETIPAWKPWSGVPGSGYQQGDKVTHNGKTWESNFAGENVWEPGTLGTENLWIEVTGATA